MKFGLAFVGLSSLVTSTVGMVNTHKDQHHLNKEFIGNSIWIFGSGGIAIFNPDGTSQLKSIEPDNICHMVTGYRGGDPSLSCNFYDAVSDGKKYVWAAVSRGVPKIDILEIDTGSVVGSFETCMNPRDLEYHPLREEIWVRCANVESNATYPSYMDVFSTSSPSVAISSDMKFKEDTTINSWGYTVVDNTLGDVGYSTDWDQSKLFKLDLSTKSIVDQFEMPLGSGTYEMAYSPMNQHIYVRTSVCCTCGFPGADVDDCGRYGSSNVTVTTGPFAGQTNVKGMCGRCEGIPGVDTLGVYEFDTTTDTVVGNHIMKENFGGDPYPSPDGRFIVLIGRNGGTSIRILEAGETSEKSTVFADLELGFDSTDYEDEQVHSDFAFIEIDGKNIIVFVSATENRAAIVDITNGANNIKTSYVELVDGRTTARGEGRQIEWAVGTPYVWIDGSGKQEVYVLNVLTEKVVSVITGVFTTKILSVQNYAKMQEEKVRHEAIQSAIDAQLKAMKDGAEGSDSSGQAGYTSNAYIGNNEAANTNKDDSKIDIVGIVGLIIGVCALIVGTMNVFLIANMKSQVRTTKDDLVSLGSKNVA
jgi:hypothetical protein